MDLLSSFLASFTLIFAIIDPFASVPIFLILTKKFNDQQRYKSADNAILVAGALAVAFIIFGLSILSIFGISLSSFKIFGGVVLGLLAIETVLGISFGSKHETTDINVASVIIGTPLLTGPGVITSVIVLSTQYGISIVLAATLLALAISWIIIRNSGILVKVLGQNTIEVAAKVMGLLLGALGVQFIRAGLLGA